MDTVYVVLCILIGLIAIALLSIILYLNLKSPFKYPYFVITIDVSGKRSPNVYNLVDTYLNSNGIDEFLKHYEEVKKWKNECKERIINSKLYNFRQHQYEKVVDDEHMFWFEIIRKQTRYRQENYVKTPYSVYVTISEYACNLDEIQQRYEALANIDFECTLSEYHSKEQRKRMTPNLREQIALRDNYTCQICGKYMPDGVGLHIDHIIPIKKGGKSIPSNLQVLCSKCNGRKSSN